jgi:hypothetical protein
MRGLPFIKGENILFLLATKNGFVLNTDNVSSDDLIELSDIEFGI